MDYYLQALEAIIVMLDDPASGDSIIISNQERDENRGSNWIKEDIEFWKNKESTIHHIGAYGFACGAMGSFKEFLYMKEENRRIIFDFLTRFSYAFVGHFNKILILIF